MNKQEYEFLLSEKTMCEDFLKTSSVSRVIERVCSQIKLEGINKELERYDSKPPNWELLEDSNWNLFTKLLDQYKDTLVLYMFDVRMLRDLVDKPYDDYYWVYEDHIGNRSLASCVGRFIPLKGRLTNDEYEKLEKQFYMNLEWGDKLRSGLSKNT